MVLNVLLFCVAVVSVNGQFLNTEYRLDSAPLPVKRRIDTGYEIQPSIGQEIDYTSRNVRLSNQGRRHIDNNQRGNLQTLQINVNTPNAGVIPNYQIGENNYDLHASRQSVTREQQLNKNQYSDRIQEQNNRESSILNYDINVDFDLNGNNKLRTNLDSTTKLPPRRNFYVQENSQGNFPTNHNVRIDDEDSNKQENTYYTNQNNRGPQVDLNRASQNQGKQPSVSDDNVRISENPTYYQQTNTRTNGEVVNNQNSNRRIDATQRAIDSTRNNQQKIEFTSNRNYESKPSRQNPVNKKDNRNRETYISTEPSRQNTIHDKSFTGGSISTEENELTSKNGGRSEDKDDERWIWMSSSNSTVNKHNSTVEPTLPTVDDRAAFDGDKCPTGQVRYQGVCVKTD